MAATAATGDSPRARSEASQSWPRLNAAASFRCHCNVKSAREMRKTPAWCTLYTLQSRGIERERAGEESGSCNALPQQTTHTLATGRLIFHRKIELPMGFLGNCVNSSLEPNGRERDKQKR